MRRRTVPHTSDVSRRGLYATITLEGLEGRGLGVSVRVRVKDLGSGV